MPDAWQAANTPAKIAQFFNSGPFSMHKRKSDTHKKDDTKLNARRKRKGKRQAKSVLRKARCVVVAAVGAFVQYTMANINAWYDNIMVINTAAIYSATHTNRRQSTQKPCMKWTCCINQYMDTILHMLPLSDGEHTHTHNSKSSILLATSSIV